MSNKKEAIGKGIRALLDNIDTAPRIRESENILGTSTAMIPIDSIEVNPFQPRMEFDETKLKELSESVKIHGIIQPITVRKISGKKFQLIAGERRLKACQMAGLSEIPAFVRTANDQEMLEMALIENTHREDLNAIEVAINYKRLIDECSLKQEELAERVGKDRTSVTNYLRLLKLPVEVQSALKGRQISMGHARALISIEDPLVQLHIFKEMLKKEMSVRQVEQLVREYTPTVKSKKISEPKLPYQFRQIESDLASALSTKVQLKRTKAGKGEIVISYFSDDDLERIIEIIEKD